MTSCHWNIILIRYCEGDPPFIGEFHHKKTSSTDIVIIVNMLLNVQPSNRWSDTPWRSRDNITTDDIDVLQMKKTKMPCIVFVNRLEMTVYIKDVSLKLQRSPNAFSWHSILMGANNILHSLVYIVLEIRCRLCPLGCCCNVGSLCRINTLCTKSTESLFLTVSKLPLLLGIAMH